MKSKKKYRFFNTYEPASPIYRDLIPKLTDAGFRCEIVVSKGEYRKGRDLNSFVSENANIDLISVSSAGAHSYKGKIQKIIVAVTFFLFATYYSFVGSKGTINVYLTQPPFLNLLGFLSKKIIGRRYACVVMDLQPQEAIEFGAIKREGFPAKALLWLSSLAYRHADATAVIGRCMKEKVIDMGVDPEKVAFIPNWVDETSVLPVKNESNSFRSNNNLAGKFVVFYGGNIGNAQHYDDILEVAKEYSVEEKLVFLFVGSGSRENIIDDFIEKNSLTNVIRLPLQHESYSLSEILSAGDIHFISLKDSCTGLAVPSKTYAALATGRPIIYQGSKSGEIARLVSEHGNGIVVNIGDNQAIYAFINRMMHHPAELAAYSEKSRELALGVFSRENSSEAYKDLLVGVSEDSK